MYDEYLKKVDEQIKQYSGNKRIHDLPEIFHYWSNKHLVPLCREVLGVESVAEFYGNEIQSLFRGEVLNVVSLGCGEFEVEAQVAKYLHARNFAHFTITGFEISKELLLRSEARIASAGLQNHLRVVEADINDFFLPRKSVDVVIANHSLHHFLRLEHIFDSVFQGLRDNGVFVTSDVIGRNGHQRWPECRFWIEKLWAFLPDQYKYNHLLSRHDNEFTDWDCSTEGFEGIRAEDILPQLLSRFRFQKFLAYGGIVEIFIDRCFGHNYSSLSGRDKAFIDFVQELNTELLLSGNIKPTMMFAVMDKGLEGDGSNICRAFRHLLPEFALR